MKTNKLWLFQTLQFLRQATLYVWIRLMFIHTYNSICNSDNISLIYDIHARLCNWCSCIHTSTCECLIYYWCKIYSRYTPNERNERKIEIFLLYTSVRLFSSRNTTRRFKRFYGRMIRDATIYVGLRLFPPLHLAPVHFILECIVLSSKI